TEIKIKRISRFDSFKADELLEKLSEELEQTEFHLAHLVEFAINYFKKLLEKYGKGRERKTEIRAFDTIAATVVAANNAKLYVNRADGFIGFGLKKDEYVCECSDMDEIIVFRKDGKMMVSKIVDKVFVGKNIEHVAIFKKNDERMVYNLVYVDAKSGKSRTKRFNVKGVTRDKEYDLTKGAQGSQMLYFTANPNGEAEVITVSLSSRARARIKVFDYDFSSLEIKGRGAGGNILTKYPVRRIQLKAEGKSTLGGVDIYYDDAIGRLNRDERGKHLGKFNSEDSILVIYDDGTYELTTFELSNRYESKYVKLIEKFYPEAALTAIYQDGSSRISYIKKFNIETTTLNKKFLFISESKGSKLLYTSSKSKIVLAVDLKNKRSKETTELQLDDLVGVKGWKAVGNRFFALPITKIKELSGDEQEYEILDKIDEHTPEVSDEKTETPEAVSLNESKTTAPEVLESEDPQAELAKKPDKEKHEESTDLKTVKEKVKEKEKQDEIYHSGDSVEMKIDMDEVKKKRDQLDLFDD
ncbi:MAG: DNA gyrase/topoisomerase IV subunit A, partial [Cyclobacteriaceae bacterium]|nr:DNA gyrase/topoisomerase IV subunit A [Cyclobacteriaceae bacterium]